MTIDELAKAHTLAHYRDAAGQAQEDRRREQRRQVEVPRSADGMRRRLGADRRAAYQPPAIPPYEAIEGVPLEAALGTPLPPLPTCCPHCGQVIQ